MSQAPLPDFSHVHFGDPTDFSHLRTKLAQQLEEIRQILAAEAADLIRERQGKLPIYGVGTAVARRFPKVTRDQKA